MSQLSEEERTAGISRSALRTLAAANGRANGRAIETGSHANHPVASERETGFRDPSAAVVPGQPPVKTSVIDSWCRDLVVINHDGYGFSIRDTMHYGHKADVVTLSLNRNDLEALKRGIEKALAESRVLEQSA